MRKFLRTAISNSTVPGPYKMSRPEFPNWYCAGVVKALGSKYRLRVQSGSTPEAIRFGRCVPVLFVVLMDEVGVNGRPEYRFEMPLTSQPPMIRFWLAKGSLYVHEATKRWRRSATLLPRSAARLLRSWRLA